MPDPAFTEQPTVKRYADSLGDMSAQERDARLQTLAEFSRYVDRSPDEMVAEIFNTETRKYRKRGFYSERIKEFGRQLDGSNNAQLARGNVIRAFFIANGRRVPPEQPDWMQA